MTTVTVAPPVVDVFDVLDYAHALIEEHGWRQGPRVPEGEDWDEVAKNGLSLHDAIGMACYRLSGETGKQTMPTRAGASSKDFPLGAKAADHGYSGTLRTAATELVVSHIPGGAQGARDDVRFNDEAQNVGEVIAVLEEAMKEAMPA